MSNHSGGVTAIIGAGAMAIEHYKVLKHLGVETVVFGRGKGSAKTFYDATGHMPLTGDLSENLAAHKKDIDKAIVAVTVAQLAPVTTKLLDAGIEYVLLEKPGGVNPDEVELLAGHQGADGVRIAYNRRFLPSARTAMKAIEEDGGITSFHFEFNENVPLVASLTQHPDTVKENWFYANSTHIADLAFFLAGRKAALAADTVASAQMAGDFTAKPANARFGGCGQLDDVVFTYMADWSSAGRWGIEICTAKRRLVMKPIETVSAINRGGFGMVALDLIDQEPDGMKPGFFHMVKAFVENPDDADLLTLKDQTKRLRAFEKMVTPQK